MRLLYIFLLFLSCTFFLHSPAISYATTGDKTIEVDGIGNTKKDALLQAKRSAVEEGIGVVLTSQTEVENFMLKKDRVITQSVGSVKSYSLLKAEQKGQEWFVKIRAVVSLDSITADLMALKILLVSMDKPRTMVLISEEEGKNTETVIVDYLQSKGFDLVDPAQTAALMEKKADFIQLAIQGDPVAAAKLGAENGAEYILVGTVQKSLLENNFVSSNGMQSGQATMTAKVINCSNGRIVATKSANGAAVHISPDIAKARAATKVGSNLMDQELFEAIVASFQDTINNGANYDITVTNIPSYSTQKHVTRLFESTEGVVSVAKRGFGGGKLKLSVVFKGNVDALCDSVDSKKINNTTLMVTDVVGNRVSLQLQ